MYNNIIVACGGVCRGCVKGVGSHVIRPELIMLKNLPIMLCFSSR